MLEKLKIGQIWEACAFSNDSGYSLKISEYNWNEIIILQIIENLSENDLVKCLTLRNNFPKGKNLPGKIIKYPDDFHKAANWRLAANQNLGYYGACCSVCLQYYEGAINHLTVCCWQCELKKNL